MKVGVVTRMMRGPEGALSVGQADDGGGREAVGAGAFQARDRDGADKTEAARVALGADLDGGNAGFLSHAVAVVVEGENVPVASGGGIEFPVMGMLARSPQELEAGMLPELQAPRRVWRRGGKVGGLVETVEVVLDAQGINGDGKLAGEHRGRLLWPVEGDQSEDGLAHGLVPRVRVRVARLSHGGTE